MFVAQTLYQSHQQYNITFDIYNYTENYLIWNDTAIRHNIENNLTRYVPDNVIIFTKRISNIIFRFLDFVGFSLFEISKFSMEFGYNHPEYDFKYCMNLLKYFLFAWLAILIFPIIIPLIALIYLIFKGLKKIAVRLLRHFKVID